MTAYPFRAAKLDEGGDWTYLDCLTLEDWLVEQEAFFPLKPGDFFRLIVPDGVDLLALVGEGMFVGGKKPTSTSSFLQDNYLSETMPMGIRDFWWDIDGHPERIDNDMDAYLRYAVVLRGEEVWQIVGFDLDDRIVYALQRNWDSDEDEAPGLTRRFASSRVLIDYSFHTDGPGPVSWDVYTALLDMGDWALGVYDVDPGPVCVPISLKPSLPQAIFDWLKFNDVLELFVLKHAECNWVDQKLREALEEARWGFQHIAGLDSSLSKTEADSVLDFIRDAQSTAGELLRMFESTADDRATDFVKRMVAASEAENASEILNKWI